MRDPAHIGWKLSWSAGPICTLTVQGRPPDDLLHAMAKHGQRQVPDSAQAFEAHLESRQKRFPEETLSIFWQSPDVKTRTRFFTRLYTLQAPTVVRRIAGKGVNALSLMGDTDRPLEEKLHSWMDFLTQHWHSEWGTSGDEDALINKFRSLAHLASNHCH
eukprot:gene29797-7432_t